MRLMTETEALVFPLPLLLLLVVCAGQATWDFGSVYLGGVPLGAYVGKSSKVGAACWGVLPFS